MNFWFIEATNRIRRRFEETLILTPEWKCEQFSNTKVDTRWFLKEFGAASLGLSYCAQYTLVLKRFDNERFNRHTISRLLEESDYGAIRLAFDRIDRRWPDWDSELIEDRNFKFGTPNDGYFSRLSKRISG